ncbi:MAG: ABC transporter substrate-binding protein, partial [Eubacteriales bacterium]
MKIFKKLTASFLAGIMLFSIAGCSGGQKGETTSATTAVSKIKMNVAALKGPTGIGLVELMDENDKKTTEIDYKFELLASPTDIVPLITTGAADIAALPLNLASTLYNKTNGGIQILAINTLGVLYVLEQGDTIRTIADLKGKTIYSSGQGASPEYILNFVLNANGIDPKEDVKIEYKADHSELAALAASGKTAISMLPEPFVTTALSKNKNLRIALDMTKEWEKACKKTGTDGTLAMGCIVVRTEFAKKNPKAVLSFLKGYMASVDYVNT